MAYFTMQRDFIVKALGRSVGFKKGIETWVPPMIHAEAMKYGAVPVDPKEDLEMEKAPERPKVITNEDRHEALLKACKYLKEVNDGDDFGANALPKVKALNAVVGFDVSAQERDKAWREIMQVGNPETNDG